MALLRLEADEHEKFDYVRLADDGDRVFVGQEVHSIGDTDYLVRSFTTGMVQYPFEGYNQNDLVMDFTGARIEYNHEASLNDLSLHRTVGNVALGSRGPYAHLNPNIPILQIRRYFPQDEAHGSPVFNSRGNVVGMLFTLDGPFNLAIHYCALKHFIDCVRLALNDGSSFGDDIWRLFCLRFEVPCNY